MEGSKLDTHVAMREKEKSVRRPGSWVSGNQVKGRQIRDWRGPRDSRTVGRSDGTADGCQIAVGGTPWRVGGRATVTLPEGGVEVVAFADNGALMGVEGLGEGLEVNEPAGKKRQLQLGGRRDVVAVNLLNEMCCLFLSQVNQPKK